MKPIANNAALLLSFFLCLSFLPLLNAAGNNSLVAETCQKAKYKDLCISSLEAEYASQDADLAALALIAVEVASKNGSDTSVYIKKTLDGTNLEPTVEQNFEDCSENYVSAMEQLDDSLEALVSKNYEDVKTWLEAAITDATTCETQLIKQSPGEEMELFNKNNVFRQLCSNALDIVNLLATN
ncbi:pectinesterase inhibitor 9-like [Durio zibethinus]|uniref:Pectinesterase inhibitor 9-like n=1 Tax=Durio zibethinus TaxID=66656 RepID=A0A6P6AY64_DURZI|nr:pectinesterase inhibitor 9-like [Durio zibethinus]